MTTPAPRIDSVTWQGAIGDVTGTRFAEIAAAEIVLEGSIFTHPISGVAAVLTTLRLVAGIYDELRFSDETLTPERTVLEWEASALGLHISGVTVLALGGDGRVRHVGLHVRPAGAVLRLSAEIGDRLTMSTNGRQNP